MTGRAQHRVLVHFDVIACPHGCYRHLRAVVSAASLIVNAGTPTARWVSGT